MSKTTLVLWHWSFNPKVTQLQLTLLSGPMRHPQRAFKSSAKNPRWEALKARWSPKKLKYIKYMAQQWHTSSIAPTFNCQLQKNIPSTPKQISPKRSNSNLQRPNWFFDKLGMKTIVHSLVVSFRSLPLPFCKPVAKGDPCKRPRTKFTWREPISFHEAMASHVQRWECMSQDWHQAGRIRKSREDYFKMDSWQVSCLLLRIFQGLPIILADGINLAWPDFSHKGGS